MQALDYYINTILDNPVWSTKTSKYFDIISGFGISSVASHYECFVS